MLLLKGSSFLCKAYPFDSLQVNKLETLICWRIHLFHIMWPTHKSDINLHATHAVKERISYSVLHWGRVQEEGNPRDYLRISLYHLEMLDGALFKTQIEFFFSNLCHLLLFCVWIYCNIIDKNCTYLRCGIWCLFQASHLSVQSKIDKLYRSRKQNGGFKSWEKGKQVLVNEYKFQLCKMNKLWSSNVQQCDYSW
jgi:hypothetical protein